MKKFGFCNVMMMMEMCMQTWCMCMTSYAKISDMFSYSEVNFCAA